MLPVQMATASHKLSTGLRAWAEQQGILAAITGAIYTHRAAVSFALALKRREVKMQVGRL